MQPGALLHLSIGIKRLVFCILILGVIASLGLIAYGMIAGGDKSIYFESGVSLLRFAITGLALALVALFSTKTISTDELLRQTTIFLTKEMPRAFRGAILTGNHDESSWSTSRYVADVSSVIVKVDHVRGSTSASYAVTGVGGKIIMRITLNAFRFVVLYYIPRIDLSTEKSVISAIDLVVSGAKSVGYSSKVAANLDVDKTNTFVEVYFYKMVDHDLLNDTSARLFWSQDIAVMTKSMILQLDRYGIVSS